MLKAPPQVLGHTFLGIKMSLSDLNLKNPRFVTLGAYNMFKK